MGIIFEDNSVKVKEILSDAITSWLYEAAGEVEAQVKRNTRVQTGKTKSSWSYVVDEGEQVAIVGSSEQNAIWEEFGTGIYAVNGDGRKTGWRYQDEKGKWHGTKGKKPSRAFTKAFNSLKKPITERFQEIMKEVFR